MSSQVLPPKAEAHVRPLAFCDGNAISLEVNGLDSVAGETVTLILHATTAIESSWIASVPVSIDAAGRGTAPVASGLSLGREASIYVWGIAAQDGTTHVFPQVAVSVMNPASAIAGPADALVVHERLLDEQAALYLQPLGDRQAAESLEHRVLCVIEGLYMTTRMRLPGAVIVPVLERPGASEERLIINGLLQKERFATQLPEAIWRSQAEARSPLTVMIFPEVWAPTYEAAGELARDLRDRVIALMAVNRSATGRPLCIVIEQRQSGNAVVSKWALESEHYVGNLAGGFISGESQYDLLRQTRAVEHDPLLKLCCDLYGEALSERSEDARYLRFWSILELLSGARMPSNVVVTLRDGSPWPNPGANTTRTATPRVYQYLAVILSHKQIDEQSVVAPATDLYEAVRVWYARRNATGHHGRLVVGDPGQMTQSWYQFAVRSAAATPGQSWSRPLQEFVAMSIDFEIGQSTAAL
ncbi:hypothetical protein ACJ5H2_04930 [Nocardioides sp. R1-1]|uniref:hypothetical protein n=1 Tax=Nocardioides sp. R1-1 TaxID=3383502 RepID=UPI0038D11A58